MDFLIHWPPGPVVATVQCQGLHTMKCFYVQQFVCAEINLVIFSFQLSGFLTVAKVHTFKLLHFNLHQVMYWLHGSVLRGEGERGGKYTLYCLNYIRRDFQVTRNGGVINMEAGLFALLSGPSMHTLTTMTYLVSCCK